MKEERKLRDRLTRYLRKASWMRILMGGTMILTGASGFLVSHGLMRLDWPMAVRYPVAVLAAYAVFLMILRLWVAMEKRLLDSGLTVPSGRKRDSERSWYDSLDIPDLSALGDGCLAGAGALLVAILVFVAVALAAVILVSAPLLLVEVLVDVLLVSAMARRLGRAQREHWLGIAVKHTGIWFAAGALLLAGAGFGLQQFAPGAKSIGPAVKTIWGQWQGKPLPETPPEREDAAKD